VSENLDLVRSIYAAWEQGDFGSADWADPEMLYEYADGPSPGTWNGPDGMAEGFRDFLGAWKDWGVVADDYLELAGERVLVSFHLTGRGKASGLDIARVHTNGATLFVIGDGRITRVVQYLDRDRAVADLGLEE
jgi:ketosteroid isomerase-like protein